MDRANGRRTDHEQKGNNCGELSHPEKGGLKPPGRGGMFAGPEGRPERPTANSRTGNVSSEID